MTNLLLLFGGILLFLVSINCIKIVTVTWKHDDANEICMQLEKYFGDKIRYNIRFRSVDLSTLEFVRYYVWRRNKPIDITGEWK